jgi:hypothetical protein
LLGSAGRRERDALVTDDLVAAVREEFKENEDLPNTSNPRCSRSWGSTRPKSTDYA